MKNIPWLIEPITGTAYVRDEVPHLKLRPINQYRRIEDFNPPSVWGGVTMIKGEWDDWLINVFGKQYELNAEAAGASPVDVRAQVLMFGKSWARLHGLHSLPLGVPGVIFWGNWTRIPPSWCVVDRDVTYKLLTEKEAGIEH